MWFMVVSIQSCLDVTRSRFDTYLMSIQYKLKSLCSNSKLEEVTENYAREFQLQFVWILCRVDSQTLSSGRRESRCISLCLTEAYVLTDFYSLAMKSIGPYEALSYAVI